MQAGWKISTLAKSVILLKHTLKWQNLGIVLQRNESQIDHEPQKAALAAHLNLNKYMVVDGYIVSP